MKPWPHQWGAVEAFWRYFGDGGRGNPLIVMPQGTGKSLVNACIVRTILEAYPHQVILCLTHVKELIEQNYAKMKELWPHSPAAIYSASVGRKELGANVTFGGVGSVVKALEHFRHVDLLIIDEAHLVSPVQTTMYRQIIDKLLENNPRLKVLGLTATPFRMGQGRLTDPGGIFTDVCYDISSMEAFNWLIDEGFLCPLIPKNTELQLPEEGLRLSGGDYTSTSMTAAFDKWEITEAAIKETLMHGADRGSWLVFCAGVEHAVHTAEILNSMGVSARPVHGNTKRYKMHTKQRTDNFAHFKLGKFQALVTNEMATTGFDHPMIDMIVSLRKTRSPGLWGQMVGRGTRCVFAKGYDLHDRQQRFQAIMDGGKYNCLVMDFAGNTRVCGPINDPVIPRPRKKGGKGPALAAVKTCKAILNTGMVCETIVHMSARQCPVCGNAFNFKPNIRESAFEDELIRRAQTVEYKTERLTVKHVSYAAHRKVKGLTSLRVSYLCGVKVYNEYICLEHTGGIRNKAENWWLRRWRGATPWVPNTVDVALTYINMLQTPDSILVQTGGKYDEIIQHLFNGV